MSVAAVIPTIGRPELVRAVKSVLNQSVPVLPVVVLDRPEFAGSVRDQLATLPHQLVTTSGAAGGAAARNLGVHSAPRDVIAFLDDDDEWMPQKTERQLELLRASPAAAITSRAVLKGTNNRVVPEVPYTNDRAIADYLLDRSTIKLRKNFIQSSTLMMSRDTAISVAWQSELPRHQDWTLLIELRRREIAILTHPESLVCIYQGSNASISRSTDWRASEAWLDGYAATASATARGDFLCSIVMRSAIAAGDLPNARRVFMRAIALRPHLAALVVGASELARKK
jgi:hypothetical protein